MNLWADGPGLRARKNGNGEQEEPSPASLWAGSSPASGLRVRRKPASAVWVPSLPPAGPGT